MGQPSLFVTILIVLGVLLSLWVTWPGRSSWARRPAWQQWLRWLIFLVNLVSGAVLFYLLLRSTGLL